jgi:hypothetical protein
MNQLAANILAAAAGPDVQPLAFNWAFSKWLVLLAVVVAGVSIFYLYRAQRRIAPPRLVKTLTAIRLAIVVLMFVLLAGPVYQWRHVRNSRPTLWVLVDQSTSMARADHQMSQAERLAWARALKLLPTDATTRSATNPSTQGTFDVVANKTRLELAIEAVKLLHAPAGVETRLVAFADAVTPVTVSQNEKLPDVLKNALKPSGYSTDLAGALRWVNEQIGPDDRASVVVISDGRQSAARTGASADLIEPARLLAARDVHVYTVAIGSDQLVPDAAIEQIDAPDWIYQGDTLRAAALVRLDGLAGRPVTVEFKQISPAAPATRTPQTQPTTAPTDRATRVVAFDDKPEGTGVFEYELNVRPVAGEAGAQNNAQRLRVTVKKDRLNVLVVDRQPRWEYRYLTNYLERDRRVKIQKILLEPAEILGVDRPPPVTASPDNPSTEAQLLPQTFEQWAAFDLIVLGDVPPERLPPDHQAFIAKAVKDRGKSVIFIAGQQNMPSRYANDFAGLFPVELTSAWTSQHVATHLKDGFSPSVTPEGAASVLGQFTLDASHNAELSLMLPKCYWHSEQTRAKPAASVLWTIEDVSAAPTTQSSQARDASRDRALLATMPLGLGRVMYLASDSTWRLRQVNGENLHERFWGQVVRWVVGDDLPAGGKLVKFGADKLRYAAGEPVTVTARLLAPTDMTPLVGKDVTLVAKTAGGKQLSEMRLAELPDAPGYYKGTIPGLPEGRVELSLAGGEVEKSFAADATVVTRTLVLDVLPHRDDESANLNTDFPALSRVAQASGGLAVVGPDAGLIAQHLPSEEFKSEKLEQAGLFSDPQYRATRRTHWTFLALFVGLLTAEWVIRKSAGLV